MNEKLLEQGEKYEKSRKHWKRWQKLVGALACIVVFCTTYALILPAITMERTAYCGYEEHTHGEECYTKELTCGYPENPAAQPTVAHQHTDTCYTEEKELICGKEELEGHTHTDECKHTEQVLICNVPESEGHTHSDSCYNEAGEQICGKEESEGHIHTDSCYETRVTYVCGKEESEGHTHTDACYETKKVLTCGQEETSGQTSSNTHVHTDACYKKVLTCDQEEHTHTLICYSNPNADVETAEIWERTIPTELSGIWADDVLAVAKSQLGYRESTDNYIVEEDGTTMKGYTRYGAWYGDSYGDWCAMFISFCLNYAEVPRNEVPIDCNCQNWIQTLSDRGMYFDASSDYQPEQGDLIFFSIKKNGTSDHVGLVAEVNEYTIKTIEGNSGNQVEYNTYDINDARILGYGELPENPEAESEAAIESAVMLLDDDTDSDGSGGSTTNAGNTLPVTTISGTNVSYDKNTDTYKANVNIEFEFTADTAITAGIVYSYTYPEGIVVPPGELNKKQTLLDNSKRNAGTYEFVQNEDGSYSVQIVFNENYVTNFCNKGEKVTGYVNFEGEFSKSKVQEDGSIVIGGGDLQINVPAKDITYPDEETDEYNISATKQGEWIKSEDVLTYTVYIRTTKGTPDLINFIDTITIPDGLGLGQPTVSVEKGITNYYNGWYSDSSELEKVVNVVSNYNSETGELTMELDGLKKKVPEDADYYQAEFYKITYTYSITESNWTGEIKTNNTVVVSATDTTKNQTVKSEASTELYLRKDTSHTLEKYGEESDSQIKWTIIVNKNQVNIAGAVLTDEMLKDAKKMTVLPSDGYAYDETNGTITFNAGEDGVNLNRYIIVYYTSVEDAGYNDTTVTNSATFDPTPDQPNNGDEKTVDKEVTVSGVKLDKNGWYDQNSGKIQWKIDVNSNNKDIAGSILTDSFFGGLTESDITITPANDYEFVISNENIITGIKFIAVDGTQKNTQHYTITYSTIPETTNPEEETKVSNTSNLNPGDGSTGPGDTHEVSVPPVTVTKSGYYTDSKINWIVTVNANHRDITGYELTDSMFSGIKKDDIKITYNNWGGDVPAGEYNIITDEAGYVIKIVFNKKSDSDVNTNQYFLSYTTTAEAEWNDKVITNDVHLKKDTIDIPTSAEVTVPGIKKVDKSAESLIISEDGKTGTVEWTVTIDVPSSGLPAGVVITDDVTKNGYGNTNNLQWMTWEQINSNGFVIQWKDTNGSTIGTSNPYDDQGNPIFNLRFLASDGKEYDFKTIRDNADDNFRKMTYTILTMTFAEGLIPPENVMVSTQISFSYSTTVDLEHSNIGTNHFYNLVDVDGEKADDYIDYEKPGVVKTDKDGNEDTSETSSDGELIWKVKVKTVGNDLKKVTVTDKLPNGVMPKNILVQGNGMSNVNLTVDADNHISGDGSPYHYSGTFDPDTGEIVLEITNQTAGSVLLENQEWNFTFTCEADDTVLPSGQKHMLTNTVTVTTDKGSLGSDSQTQEWTHTESTEETKVVQKSGEWDNSNRLLSYSIVLNPQGKDLVNDVDTLTLVDVLKYQSTNIGANWYEGTDGATFTVKADLVQNSVRLFKAIWQNGQWIKGEEITDFSWVYNTEKANDWGETVTNTLTVSGVPDGYPLIFEYAYSVSSSAENHTNEEKIKFNLPFSNEAKLEGTEHSGSSSSTMEEWSHSSSSAGVTTGHHTYIFYKVVKDNYNKALPGAVFSVYEYSKTEGKWLPEPIHTYTTDSEGKFVITFEDTNEAGEQIYKYNTVYGISETVAPDGYIKPDGYNPKYFYFSNNEADDNMPDTIQSGAIDLSVESATAYVENIPNVTEVTVEKIWQDSDGKPVIHNNGSVTVNLYQKIIQGSGSGEGEGSGNVERITVTVKIGSYGADGALHNKVYYCSPGDKVKITIKSWGTPVVKAYLPSGNFWSATDTLVPVSSTSNSNQINSFVYEYEVGSSETEIEIGATTGDNGTADNVASELIKMSSDSSESSGSGEESSSTGRGFYKTGTLDANSGWKYIFTGLPLTGTDEDGNTVNYYYYVEEISVPNYDTSYENNGGIQSGTITVTNKATDNPEFALPETGGHGTLRYIMGGILLMLASVLLYIRKFLKEGRRKHI